MNGRSRLLRIAIVASLAVFAASSGSFYRARSIANRYVGALPHELRQTHHGLIPFRPYAPTQHWGWAIAYDDANGDGFEVYVSLLGHVLGTSPPGLHDQLPFANAPATISTAPPNER